MSDPPPSLDPTAEDPSEPRLPSEAESPATDASLPRRRRLGLGARIGIGVLGTTVLLAVAAGIFIVPNLEDEWPFQDKDLLVDEEPPMFVHNAWPEVRRALGRLDGAALWFTTIDDGTPLSQALEEANFGSFSRDEPGSPGTPESWARSPLRVAVETLVADHSDFYRRVDEACERPSCRMSEPAGPLDGVDDWFGRLRDGWQLMRLRSDLAFARGDAAETVEADRKQLRFSAHLVDGARSSIQLISGLAQLRVALETIENHLGAGFYDAEAAAALHAQLDAIEVDRTLASAAIRTEYRLFRSMVKETPRLLEQQEIPAGPLIEWSFHPNETLRILGEYYRAAIIEGESTGRVLETPRPAIAGTWFGRLLGGNALGQLLLTFATLELDSLYLRADEVSSRIAVVREEAAARADGHE